MGFVLLLRVMSGVDFCFCFVLVFLCVLLENGKYMANDFDFSVAVPTCIPI